MTGNFEIFLPHMTLGEESVGVRFEQQSLASLPSLLEDMGFRKLVSQVVPADEERRLLAVWTATAPDGRSARVLAWEDVPFEETAIGKALASGAIETGE